MSCDGAVDDLAQTEYVIRLSKHGKACQNSVGSKRLGDLTHGFRLGANEKRAMRWRDIGDYFEERKFPSNVRFMWAAVPWRDRTLVWFKHDLA